MTGRAVTRANGGAPVLSAAAGRRGFKAELDDLRERMRGLGLGFEEIAGEMARRYRLRPREAYRLAYGWTLDHAAARFNAHAAREGTDPEARAGLTGPRLCEYEKVRHEAPVRREALGIEGGARPPRQAVAAVWWELSAVRSGRRR